MPRVGDKVRPGRSEMVYEILRVYEGGDEVDLQVPGINLQRFRVRTDSLTFVERKPPAKTSNPFTTPEPEIDTAEVMERIATVQEENLKRLDEDIDILKANAGRTQSCDLHPRRPDGRAARELEEGGQED